MTDLRQRLGLVGERLAAEHFERLGYDVVARRFRTRFGELDLVLAAPGVLVFCEVKTRRVHDPAWQSHSPEKCLQVRRMAAAWLVETDDRPHAETLRFDAVAVTIDARERLVRLDHHEAAF